jgi:hypothetical protein
MTGLFIRPAYPLVTIIPTRKKHLLPLDTYAQIRILLPTFQRAFEAFEQEFFHRSSGRTSEYTGRDCSKAFYTNHPKYSVFLDVLASGRKKDSAVIDRSAYPIVRTSVTMRGFTAVNMAFAQGGLRDDSGHRDLHQKGAKP